MRRVLIRGINYADIPFESLDELEEHERMLVALLDAAAVTPTDTDADMWDAYIEGVGSRATYPTLREICYFVAKGYGEKDGAT